MQFKVNGVTYYGPKKNSLAWYVWTTIKAIGYLMGIFAIIGVLWAFTSLCILLLG